MGWLLAILVPCTVLGTFYDHDGALSVDRTDGCPLRVERGLHEIVVSSDDRWVLVKIPEKYRNAGHVPFWYRWRSPVAHIGRDEVSVTWGETGRG